MFVTILGDKQFMQRLIFYYEDLYSYPKPQDFLNL